MRTARPGLDKLVQRHLAPGLEDYLVAIASAFAGQALGVLSGVITARLLGPAGKGDLATVYWLPSLLTVVGTLGVPYAAAFEISQQPEAADRIAIAGVYTGLALGLLQALLAYPLLQLVLGSGKLHLLGTVRWFLLFVPLALANLALSGADQGRQDFRTYSLFRVLPSALYVGFLGLLLLAGRVSLPYVVASNLAAQAITVGIRVFLMGQRHIVARPLGALAARCGHLIAIGWRFHLPTLAVLLFMQADMALLVRLAPPDAIGYYNVGLSLALAQVSLSHTLTQVNFPKIASRNQSDARQLLQGQLRVALPVIGGVGLLAFLVAPLLIRLLFGPAFLSAVGASRWLIGAIMVWGWSQTLDNGYRGMGQTQPGCVASLLGLAVLLMVGPSAFKRAGTEGLAATVLLSHIAVATALGLRYLTDQRIQRPTSA